MQLITKSSSSRVLSRPRTTINFSYVRSTGFRVRKVSWRSLRLCVSFREGKAGASGEVDL